MTRWAREVSPDKAHPEYPRPQMVRPRWHNLNGLWDYAIRPKDAARPVEFDGKILVPFPAESALSGVKKPVGPEHRLWYRRVFSAPVADRPQRVLLHFGAVDWHAVVWVDDRMVAEHRGGYDPFQVDITDALRPGEEQQLVVSVWDPADQGYQPRGKQVTEPRGIWYTSVTGIWQTVWLEQVPQTYIDSIKLVPDVDRSELKLSARIVGSRQDAQLTAEVLQEGRVVSQGSSAGSDLTLKIDDPRLWSPEDPFLYDLRIQLKRSGQPIDRVDSYFGMRKIEVRKDESGLNRLFLNNRSLFQFGPLDQGWWPDGLYTAPTDEALRYDVEVLKKLGFNMIRKHVKVEPDRWYYHCDRLGILVWQDMPNGDQHIRRDQPDLQRSPESADNYRREYQALIDTHFNHPCIVVWVPFNEGWGQFATQDILAWTKKYDPTRLVDGPSGWTDRGVGDIHDIHRYPGPAMPEPESRRAVVLGEFGGLGLPMEGHLWWDKRNWGYRTYKTQDELQTNYEQLIQRLRPLIGRGLAAAVYTQTTDVEGEVNGLMTYDRAVVKFDAQRLAELHRKLYLPPPIIIQTVVLPTSEDAAQSWRYTTEQPGDDWTAAAYDDSKWPLAKGGFGEPSTPGAVVRTRWKTESIWLRRHFELPDIPSSNLHLRIHHDEDVEVWINGQRVARLSGYVSEYVEIPLAATALAAFRAGKNTMAVHCRQTGGGQYIDVGLVEIVEKPR